MEGPRRPAKEAVVSYMSRAQYLVEMRGLWSKASHIAEVLKGKQEIIAQLI